MILRTLFIIISIILLDGCSTYSEPEGLTNISTVTFVQKSNNEDSFTHFWEVNKNYDAKKNEKPTFGKKYTRFGAWRNDSKTFKMRSKTVRYLFDNGNGYIRPRCRNTIQLTLKTGKHYKIIAQAVVENLNKDNETMICPVEVYEIMLNGQEKKIHLEEEIMVSSMKDDLDGYKLLRYIYNL